jgi:hypothetical protein
MTVFTFLTLSDGIVYVPRLKKFRSVIGVDQSLLDEPAAGRSLGGRPQPPSLAPLPLPHL